MDKLKLKWKIFSFLLGFSALLLVILWFFQTVLLTDMYKIIRKSQIEKAITLVEENINSPNLQTVLNELEADKEIIVKQMQEFTPPQRPLQDDRGRPQPETITKTQAFTLHNGSIISLSFFAMVTPVDATVSTLQMQLCIITVIMLLLSIVIAFVIAKKVSKPIENINKSAKQLASGKYDTNFYGQGFLEIKELSDTLNTAASELSKVECLRRELMANISHDLRTPLALIYSYAEMMHDFPNEITPEQTQIIMDETKRLASLVNDVLDVSRLETGTMELICHPYNLTQSISITLDRIVELVKKEGYSISFEYTEDLYVTADEVKITQAFYNLLINALHYSGDDKKITIRQNSFDDLVKIQVIDNGEGIVPENLPYIWDRYYKVDKKHKRSVIGTGLGLSIVKKIIELHDGNYGVESQVGGGSTFWFTIKLNK
ncbi:MAG: HAMP domain-containing sensor histidine kinase [Clostridium sp.]|uniref:HAMP domain-containing sensor histidine kinase n=1 Tax=Clostridium sp. TaxID=1506 RepID=UPI00301E8D9D